MGFYFYILSHVGFVLWEMSPSDWEKIASYKLFVVAMLWSVMQVDVVPAIASITWC